MVLGRPATGAQRGARLGARLGALAGGTARGIAHPSTVHAALPRQGPPVTGLAAVLVRFVVTDLVATLPLALLGRRPFRETGLPLRPEAHYRVQAAYLPVFGVVAWLAMGATAHGLLRISGRPTEPARVLDVLGVGMLAPMPALWAADGAMIAADRYRLPDLAVSHAAVQLWETVLFARGLHDVLGLDRPRSVAAAGAASGVYVLLGSRLVR